MFKGIGRLGMDAFSFSFSGGRVTGPNYSFDLNGIVGGLNSAQKDFFCSNPGQLVSYIHDDWNKKFNANCIASGGNLSLGVEWIPGCLYASGTANLLSAATSGIQNDVASWAKTAIGCGTATTQPPSTPPSTNLPPSGQASCPSVFMHQERLGYFYGDLANPSSVAACNPPNDVSRCKVTQFQTGIMGQTATINKYDCSGSGSAPITGSSASPDFFGGIGSIGILAAIAVVGLLLLKR